MYTLMLVDDDPIICEIFSVFLKKNGYRVYAVPGGRECLDLLKTTVPDLVLLDIMMEPMDGWETLSSIRTNPATQTIPVIVLTGKQPAYDEIIRYCGGVEDYLMKPMDFRSLMQSLAAYFERRESRQKEAERLQRVGSDKALVDEYYQLTRTSAITENLRKRFGSSWRVDEDDIRKRQARLHQLKITLGFPVSGQDTDHHREKRGVR
jgi:DNA-binding response OmpR family regulator